MISQHVLFTPCFYHTSTKEMSDVVCLYTYVPASSKCGPCRLYLLRYIGVKPVLVSTLTDLPLCLHTPGQIKTVGLRRRNLSVSEIKGAPCARCAHFHGRVHDFRRCAPFVCTFFEPINIATYTEGARRNSWVHSFKRSASCGRTK